MSDEPLSPASPPARPDPPPRVRREQRTVAVMVAMYCRDHHGGPETPCLECAGLLTYSQSRVQQCSFGVEKPTCARCTVHCFRPEMRERIREVMRYSGPRMTLRHPYLAVRHMLDRRRVPDTT